MPNVPLRDQLPAFNRSGATPPAAASVEPEHMGQFARANGLDLHNAIPETEAGDVLRAKIHNLSNVEVRQLAINSGEDMGQLRVGNRKGTDDVPRQTVLSRILASHSPDEIGGMIDRGVHLQAAQTMPTAEEVDAGTAGTRRNLQHSSKKELSEIGKDRGIDLTGGYDPEDTGAMGGKLRAVESIIDDMSSGELTGRSAPEEGDGEPSTAPVETVLQRIGGARTTLQGKTQVQEHTNPVILKELAAKFREAGAWPKDVPPIEIRLDSQGNVIEANGRHRANVARAVLGPNARIPVRVIRSSK